MTEPQQPPTYPHNGVRPGAQQLADFLTGMGVELAQFPPGADGWHSEVSMRAALGARARIAQAQRTPSQPAAEPETTTAPVPLETFRPASRQPEAAVQPVPRRTSPPRAAATGPYTAASAQLPAFTASGIDPKTLMQYPMPVRPAIAAAPTAADAYRIAQKYAGMTDEQAANAVASDPTIPAEDAFAWMPKGYVDPAVGEKSYGHESVGGGGVFGPTAAQTRTNAERQLATAYANTNPEHAAMYASLAGKNAPRRDTRDDGWF